MKKALFLALCGLFAAAAHGVAPKAASSACTTKTATSPEKARAR